MTSEAVHPETDDEASALSAAEALGVGSGRAALLCLGLASLASLGFAVGPPARDAVAAWLVVVGASSLALLAVGRRFARELAPSLSRRGFLGEAHTLRLAIERATLAHLLGAGAEPCHLASVAPVVGGDERQPTRPQLGR